jgi:trehalose 6-phosphate phosphatase
VLAPLLDDPPRAGVCTDFDGTLSPIVDDPRAARPVDGAFEVLDALARRFRWAAVISGRPLVFLESHLPSSLVLAGLYGLEVSDRGVRRDHPSGGAWREVITDLVDSARIQLPPGVRVEGKGLSLTLHFREHPELSGSVETWAARQAKRSGLDCRPARMSIELHPPVPADKGTALLELAKDSRAVCFIGDDLGDLSAFDALDQLDANGVAVARIGVRSAEAPPELLARADLVVDGPPGTLELLRLLASA